MNNHSETDWHSPNWDRERPRCLWDPSRRLLASIRDYQRLRNQRNPVFRIRKILAVARHRFWSVVTASDIPIDTTIEGGLLIPHPTGIVIHPDAVIGPNCLIFQQVTIAGAVRIGCHVDIGAGAKILGPLNIGDHARIGANAVVTHDVPPHSTWVGIPARPIRKANCPANTDHPNRFNT